jgi:hypothetical protein
MTTIRCGHLAVAALTIVAGCKHRSSPSLGAVGDGGVERKPADHLGANELVTTKGDLLGLPLPRGFTVVDDLLSDRTAVGEATADELRAHVLEHTMNCVARPEPDTLVWWDCEMPGQGSKKFQIRVATIEGARKLLAVRVQVPTAVVDGGSGEVLKRLGLDGNGYPVGYDELR